MWGTFFDHVFDFSTAFDKFKRPLILFAQSLLVFSYSHHSNMHTLTFDKMLRGLITSELRS